MADPLHVSRRLAVGGLTALVPAAALAASGSARRGREQEGGGEDVAAAEDLMREHGVLRRILIAYSESAPKLSRGDRVDAAALNAAATLFRDFGEAYHERMLEEEHIFPELRRAGESSSRLVDILSEQHRRGRDITHFILEATDKGSIADGPRLSDAMAGFVRMYRAHAAREDTIAFPAWKKLHSKSELDEISQTFEDIERRTFGGDGFDEAVEKVAAIEQRLGIADLASFTVPPIRT